MDLSVRLKVFEGLNNLKNPPEHVIETLKLVAKNDSDPDVRMAAEGVLRKWK